MQPLVLILLSLAASPAEEAPGPFAEPRTAYTAAAETEIYSHPGGYVTQRLPRGVRIEVYRDEDGWSAIRPPRGSHSWVDGEQLRTVAADDDGKLAEALVDGAKVWIGTSQARDALTSRVRLQRGEQVRVLGSRQTLEDGRQRRWIKIAPPAGEFRYVRSANLRRRLPEDGADGWQVRTLPIEEPAPEAAAARGGVRQVDHEAAADPTSETTGSEAPAEPTNAPTAPPSDPSLRKLELAVARMVVLPPEDWSLFPLREQVDAYVNQATDPVQRSRARLLLERIVAFEEVQNRTLELIARDRVAATPATNPLASPENQAGRFAAQGWLMPVITRQASLPKFAITDGDGQILAFVTPAAGVNLHRYLKQRVGVDGSQRLLAPYNKPHVTAHRVTTLAAPK